MNRNCSFLPLFVLVIAAVFSCKKGEDDPFFSLRSRKARLAGDWKVVSQESNFSAVQYGTVNTATVIYDGATEKTAVNYTYSDGTTQSNTSEKTYSLRYKISKDNTYEFVQVFPDNTVTIKGSWNFLKKDKEEKIKDKEAIILFQTSVEYSTMPQANYTKDLMNGTILLIRGLSGKKVTLKYTYSFSSFDGSSSSEKSTVTTLKKEK